MKKLLIALLISLLLPVYSYADWSQRLMDAYDVDSTAPTDGQALLWDDTLKLWVAGSVAAAGGNSWTAAGDSGAGFLVGDAAETVTLKGAVAPGLSVSAASNVWTVSQTKADTSTNGYLWSTDWNTFNNKMAGTLAKDLVTTSPLAGGTDNILPGADSDITLSISKADATTNGYLWSTDWNTFNDKQAALGFTPSYQWTAAADSGTAIRIGDTNETMTLKGAGGNSTSVGGNTWTVTWASTNLGNLTWSTVQSTWTIAGLPMTWSAVGMGIGMTPYEKLSVSGDEVLAATSPKIVFRDTSDNTAYAFHYDTADSTYGYFQFWRGTDTGTGFAVNPAVPLLYFDTSNNAYFSGNLQTGGTITSKSTAEGNLKIFEHPNNGTNYIQLFAPSALAGNIVWTLPSADGSANDVLMTNGTGTLSWTAQGAGGSGDVASVGDCASGACLDGTSDGGTYIKVYDAQGAGTLIVGDLGAARNWTLPDASGTVAVSATAPATLSAAGDIGVTVLKDLVTTAPLTGGTNDILPGADADITLALTVNKDIVAGVGLSGGENDVLPGADADTTLTFDPTEVLGATWGAGAQQVWTIDLATDYTMTWTTGLLTFSHDITVGGGNINTGNIPLVVGDATTDSITFSVDGTGNAELALPADSLGIADIDWGTGTGQVPLSKSFVLSGTVSTSSDYGTLWKTPVAITITSVNVTATGGTSWSATCHLDECDANGANCAGVDGATDITVTSGTNAADDGTLSNPSIDANDWVGFHVTATTWTTGGVMGVTFNYTE